MSEDTQTTTLIGFACDSPNSFYYLANISPPGNDPESIWSVIVQVRDWENDDQDDSYEDEIWLSSIDGDSQRGIYTASIDGDILHLQRGKWRKLPFANDTAINSITVLDAQQQFFGGDQGLLGHIDQGQISTFNAPGGETVNAVQACASSGRVIAAGNAGLAYEHLDGHWQRLAPPTNLCLMSVCIGEDGWVYFGLEKGLILCWQGDIWREIDLGNDDAIVYGLAQLDGVLYCALGEKGLIQLDPQVAEPLPQPVKDWPVYELARKGDALFGAGEQYLTRFYAGVWENWEIDL